MNLKTQINAKLTQNQDHQDSPKPLEEFQWYRSLLKDLFLDLKLLTNSTTKIHKKFKKCQKQPSLSRTQKPVRKANFQQKKEAVEHQVKDIILRSFCSFRSILLEEVNKLVTNSIDSLSQLITDHQQKYRFLEETSNLVLDQKRRLNQLRNQDSASCSFLGNITASQTIVERSQAYFEEIEGFFDILTSEDPCLQVTNHSQGGSSGYLELVPAKVIDPETGSLVDTRAHSASNSGFVEIVASICVDEQRSIRA